MKFTPGVIRKEFCPFCKGDVTDRTDNIVVDHRAIHRPCYAEALGEDPRPRKRKGRR